MNPIVFITTIGALLTQPVLNKDTYKGTHWTFEHPEFTSEYAYIEARKGGDFAEVQWFGFQYTLLYYICQQVTMPHVDEAEAELHAHGIPFNRKAWERVVKKHNGYLPIIIKALPEGVIVPQGTVLATVESTDPRLAGLAAEVETILLRGAWFPTTIATRSMRWWRLINRYLEVSGDPGTSEFKMVDFGARGVSSTETAGIAGMAHLVNHQVTDNLLGIRFAKHAYRDYGMPGFSIPATEHSVTTSWGRDGEEAFFRNILKVHGDVPSRAPGDPRKPVSVVIDTYDQDAAIRKWLTPANEGGLLDDLKASDMQVVLRPDSGDPIINVVHCLDLIGSLVGFECNDKGYRILPDYVRLIQGDGINEESLRRILQRVVYHGWSIDNLVFGSGGGLLVHEVERDTHRFAMKASEVIVGGETRAISKQPKTDPSKASKAGRFSVVLRDGQWLTIPQEALQEGETDFLFTRFENGKMVNIQTFNDVREMARAWRSRPSPEERHAAIAKELLD